MRFLLIAEKPSEMRAIQDVYRRNRESVEKRMGFTLDFIALSGHIYTLMEPRDYPDWKEQKWSDLHDILPLVPDEWLIKPVPGTHAKEVQDELRDRLKNNKYDGLINATDPDVEGTGIFERCRVALHLEKYKTLRFKANSLTDADILKALYSMVPYEDPSNVNEVAAFNFRSRWDWLIGMNYSIGYSVVLNTLIKIGSVKGPTMLLIYNNCKAIDGYEKKVDYAIEATYQDGVKGYLQNDEKKEARFLNEVLAKMRMQTLPKEVKVIAYDKKTVETKAPKLFALSDLQAEATKKLDFSPAKTLEVAQSLYEKHKILSYPRTAGNYVTTAKSGEFQKILDNLTSSAVLKPFIDKIAPGAVLASKHDKNIVNDAEVAKASHDALLPTTKEVDWSALTEDERNLFLLVCKRFIAHFLGHLVEEKTMLLTDANGGIFLSQGKKLIALGFAEIFDYKQENNPIPEHKLGEVLNVSEYKVIERQTKAPARYTTGSLIKVMRNIGQYVTDPKLKSVMKESDGIGTEATRANIIDDLVKTGYITTKKEAIYITEAGKYYVENLGSDNIADPMFVAYWSYITKQVRLGLMTYDAAYNEFLYVLREGINKVRAMPVKAKEKKVLGTCPNCGKDITVGKFGAFCEGKCGFNPQYVLGKKLNEKEITGLLSGKKTTLKDCKKKDGSSYNASVKCTGVTDISGKVYYKIEFVND